MKERIKELGEQQPMINNLFKEIVPEDSEENSDREKSSESGEEDFYEKLSDHEHQPKIAGQVMTGYGGGIPRPKKDVVNDKESSRSELQEKKDFRITSTLSNKSHTPQQM